MQKKTLFIVMATVLTTFTYGLSTPASLDTALLGAGKGDIVSLGFTSVGSTNILNQGTNKLIDAGGQLIYSDDPETCTEYGILYQDTLTAGDNRLYLYHVNGLSANAKMTAIITNTGGSATNIEFSHKVLPTPSTNYNWIGKSGVRDYYESTSLPSNFSLDPGETKLLDAGLDGTIVFQNQLIGAIYDYSATQPTEVTILMLPASQDTLSYTLPGSPVTDDGDNREGTFATFSRVTATPYNYSTSSGIKAIEIGSNPTYTNYDLPLEGTDVQSGASASLRGNYGVTYSIDIDVTNNTGEDLAVLLNPRGGNYGGYVRVRYPETGYFSGQYAPSPSLAIGTNSQGAVCALLRPTAATQKMTIELIPAGASSLSIHLLLVPFTQGNPVTEWMIY